MRLLQALFMLITIALINASILEALSYKNHPSLTNTSIRVKDIPAILAAARKRIRIAKKIKQSVH
jgi:hypothetical protein